jgi:exopolyphosphatase/guanosine-5'-triphosphate,3'-diphosphate pyrophosphatase
MQDSLDVLKKYSNKILEYGLKPDQCLATATEASRVAKNAKTFYEEVVKTTKIQVKIINGKAEAYYSALGASFELPDTMKQVTIMDIGGASTELIQVSLHPFQILASVSVPIGSVRMTNWREDKIDDAKMQQLQQVYGEIITGYATADLLCVAGTMTSVANMHLKNREFVENQVHMHKMSSNDLKSVFETYAHADESSLLVEFPFLGKRAKAIAGGIAVAYFFCSKLAVKNITVSTYGLMFGTALEQKIRADFLAN